MRGIVKRVDRNEIAFSSVLPSCRTSTRIYSLRIYVFTSAKEQHELCLNPINGDIRRDASQTLVHDADRTHYGRRYILSREYSQE